MDPFHDRLCSILGLAAAHLRSQPTEEHHKLIVHAIAAVNARLVVIGITGHSNEIIDAKVTSDLDALDAAVKQAINVAMS